MLILTDHRSHENTNSLYSLAVALRKDERCHEVWVCSRGVEENQLFFSGKGEGSIFAAPIREDFHFETDGLFFQKTKVEINPEQMDVILIRLPQPVNALFMQSLKNVFPLQKIINHPLGILETSSKAFLVQLKHLCPMPVLCHSAEEALDLSQQYELVLKPLFSYGGKGLFRISKDWIWKENERFPITQWKELLKEMFFPMLSMRFLSRVTEGDKRTIIINKKIMGSAIRFPPPHHWICNVAQGGYAVLSSADEDELKIESELTPMLFEKGIVKYGFDTLIDDDGRRVLSEINTMSVGGLMPLQEMSGRPVVEEAARGIWDYVDSARP
jgi:glutathione synthase